MTRTLIISHSHPQLKDGGGEVAAYRQFAHMREIGMDVHFLGAAYDPALANTLFPGGQRMVALGRNDYIFRTAPMDIYTLEQPSVEDEDGLLRILLRYDADIYHFHHFWNIGAGVIRRLRKAKPDARLVCTLHEFMAICINDGQMIKRGTKQLCREAGPVACALCFPNHSPVNFLVRQRSMLEMLECFDLLICPSQFLADRFIAWGAPADRIRVLENGMASDFDHTGPDQMGLDRDGERSAGSSRRFAFFGQATPTKGLNILVRAARWLHNHDPELDFSIDVYGVTEDRFRELCPEEELIKDIIRFHGRYAATDVVGLMQANGWLIVPSTWWENSPVVIQEARLAGTPVIASNIGGMREKVTGWGRLFPVGDFEALGRLIEELAGNDSALEEACGQIVQPLSIAEYLALWQREVAGLDMRPTMESQADASSQS